MARARTPSGDAARQGSIAVDAQGRITAVDGDVLALLGGDEGDWTGRPVHEAIVPADAEPRGDHLALGVPLDLLCADGARIPVEATIAAGDAMEIVIHDGREGRRRLERAKRRLAQYQRAQHVARIGSWEWDVEEDEAAWSDELYRIFGMEPGEITPTRDSVLEAIHPDDREAVDAIVQRSVEDASDFAVDHRITHKDGSVHHVHSQGAAETDDQGHVVRMVGTAQDITAAVQAQEHFRQMLAATPDPIVMADRDGVIRYVNDQVHTMFGYRAEELVGEHVEALVPDALRERHRHHRGEYNQEPKVRSMGEGMELQALHKDGHSIPVEISLSPLQTPEGHMVIAAIRDVTERKRAETYFRHLLQAAPDPIVLADEEGVIQFANDRVKAMFGYAQGELTGQPVEILIPESLRTRHVEHRADFHADPKARPMGRGLELKALHKDGHTFTVEISLSPLRTPDGVMVMAAIRDVTERKKAEEADRLAFERLIEIQQLREVDKVKSNLLNIASHELKTPMTPLRLQLYLLESERLGPLTDRQRHAVQVLRRNTDRMTTLIGDVLDMARIESGRMRIHPKPVAVRTLVEETKDTFDETIKAKGITLDIDVPEALTAHADSDRVLQVVINLVSNAIKFSKAGSRIQVQARQEGDHARIEVTDQGIGISDEKQAKLFQPFGQVHDPAAITERGTGLGLFICRGIVEQHGGRIGVVSDGEGKGSTFWFSIPVKAGVRPLGDEDA